MLDLMQVRLVCCHVYVDWTSSCRAIRVEHIASSGGVHAHMLIYLLLVVEAVYTVIVVGKGGVRMVRMFYGACRRLDSAVWAAWRSRVGSQACGMSIRRLTVSIRTLVQKETKINPQLATDDRKQSVKVQAPDPDA